MDLKPAQGGAAIPVVQDVAQFVSERKSARLHRAIGNIVVHEHCRLVFGPGQRHGTHRPIMQCDRFYGDAKVIKQALDCERQLFRDRAVNRLETALGKLVSLFPGSFVTPFDGNILHDAPQIAVLSTLIVELNELLSQRSSVRCIY